MRRPYRRKEVFNRGKEQYHTDGTVPKRGVGGKKRLGRCCIKEDQQIRVTREIKYWGYEMRPKNKTEASRRGRTKKDRAPQVIDDGKTGAR